MPLVGGASRPAVGCRRGRPLTAGPRGYARRRGWRRWEAAISAGVQRGESGAMVGYHAPPPPPAPSRRSRRPPQRLVLTPLCGGRGEPRPLRWSLLFVMQGRPPGGHHRKPFTPWRRLQRLCAGVRGWDHHTIRLSSNTCSPLPDKGRGPTRLWRGPPRGGGCVVVRVALASRGN